MSGIAKTIHCQNDARAVTGVNAMRQFALLAMLVSLMGCSSSGPYRFEAMAEAQRDSLVLFGLRNHAGIDQLQTSSQSAVVLVPGDRVLITPVNFLDRVLDYVALEEDMIHSALAAYLQQQGGVMIDSELFVRAWALKVSEDPSKYDARTALFDQAQYDSALLETLLEVGQQAEVDVFIFPNIIEVQVLVSESKAAWAGVQRDVNLIHEARDTRHLRRVTNDFLWSGALMGLTLSIEAVNSDGDVLYTGTGGIGFRDKVTAEPKNNKIYSYERVAKIQPKQNPLGNTEHLQESIEAALSSYILRANAAEATAQAK